MALGIVDLLDRIGASRAMMKFLTIYCGFGFLVVLASNVWSISTWTETRAVYDDICYLRQAHLFERFGLGGLDTNVTRDDDHYLSDKLRAIGYPTWANAPCHTVMPASNKLVMQYPPGTGFALSLFPAGFQVIPLYVLSSIVAVVFSFVAMHRAVTVYSLMLVAAFGDSVIYLMINPTKASYSMAPTMMVCAAAGYLTAKLFSSGARRERLVLTASIGLLIGLSVSFRLPNLFLSAGYFIFFLGSFLMVRSKQRFSEGLAFRHRIPGRACADAGRQRDQCGKPLCDNLRRGGCRAARTERHRAVVLSRRRAVHPAGDRCGMDGADLAIQCSRKRAARRAGRCRKSRGERDLLHDPPGVHTILYDSGRDAFAVDPAVCDVASAPPIRRG